LAGPVRALAGAFAWHLLTGLVMYMKPAAKVGDCMVNIAVLAGSKQVNMTEEAAKRDSAAAIWWSRTASSGAVSPALSFSWTSTALPTASPARNLRMVPPTAAPRGLRSRPFPGRVERRGGTLWLGRMPEPVMDGLEPPSNGRVQVAGLRRQVAGPVNCAVGCVADDVVNLERCLVCCAQPVDEDPPVGQRPDIVVETLKDEKVIGVAGELGLDHAYVAVAVHAEEVEVTTALRRGAAVAAGPPCGEFSQGWLLDAGQVRISPYHGFRTPHMKRPCQVFAGRS
jgi:hypothetical protein